MHSNNKIPQFDNELSVKKHYKSATSVLQCSETWIGCSSESVTHRSQHYNKIETTEPENSL